MDCSFAPKYSSITYCPRLTMVHQMEFELNLVLVQFMFLKPTCSIETFVFCHLQHRKKSQFKEKLAKHKTQNLFGKTKPLFLHNLTIKI